LSCFKVVSLKNQTFVVFHMTLYKLII